MVPSRGIGPRYPICRTGTLPLCYEGIVAAERIELSLLTYEASFLPKGAAVAEGGRAPPECHLVMSQAASIGILRNSLL